jgi:hypothetical protein
LIQEERGSSVAKGRHNSNDSSLLKQGSDIEGGFKSKLINDTGSGIGGVAALDSNQKQR